MNPALGRAPVTTWVFKLASRCNLSCKYCYMYEGPDQSWRTLPRLMGLEHIEAGADLAARMARDQGDREVLLVLHGGEPMLATARYLETFLETCTSAAAKHGVRPLFAMQTNGTIVTPEKCRVLSAYDVEVSVSLDGTAESHDQNRVYIGGRGSHAEVLAGIDSLRDLGCAPVGAIAVADFSSDPEEFMQALFDLGIPQVEVLLPDRTVETGLLHDPEVIADWLIRATDYALSSPADVTVKSFEALLKLMYGATWGLDSWGSRCTGTAVIETDGGILLNDVLRLTHESGGQAEMNVMSAAPADITGAPSYTLFTDRSANAAPTCQECEFLHQCGGGHISHRFDAANGYANPSVYCPAILIYLAYIRGMVAAT